MDKWLVDYVDNVLPKFEGLRRHIDIAGIRTNPYGITDATKKRFPQRPNESSRDYAARVVQAFANSAKQRVGEKQWESMPEGMKQFATDMEWNLGAGWGKVAGLLKQGKYEEALNKNLEYTQAKDPKADKTAAVSTGLVQRVVDRYNMGAASLGVPNIVNFSVTPTEDGKAQVSFLNENQDAVVNLKPKFGLHSSNRFVENRSARVFQQQVPSSPEEVPFMTRGEVPMPSYAMERPEPYTVKKGDTLSEIAQRTGQSLDKLVSFNQMAGLVEDPNLIYAGQQLLIPTNKQEEEDIVTGDTLAPFYGGMVAP